jgi:hypothetical protein
MVADTIFSFMVFTVGVKGFVVNCIQNQSMIVLKMVLRESDE